MNRISPVLPWLDDRDRHIQAHGGSIIQVDGTYYWFGEDRSPDNEPGTCPISCYSSANLMNWSFRSKVFDGRNPEQTQGLWQIERPKVFHNKVTGKFVMYMHIDGQLPDHWSRYSVARVGVAVCDTVDGNYKYLRSFRPLGKESRDIGQFIDDDGSAYLIFECRPERGFHIARLSADFMDVEESVAFIEAAIEGGTIVRHEGLYYCLGSHLTGWWPNGNKYCTAESLEGPWSKMRDIASPETLTYGSQSTFLMKVTGFLRTTVIYMGDVWRPYELWDSRYLWYPVEIGGGNLALKPVKGWMPGPWTIDVLSGEVGFHSDE
ncbi:MAG: family 43 glycosylhydrolase [Luteolibacter sp.]